MKSKSREKATKKFKDILGNIIIIITIIFGLTKIIEILFTFTFEISVVLATFTVYVFWIEMRLREIEK